MIHNVTSSVRPNKDRAERDVRVKNGPEAKTVHGPFKMAIFGPYV